MTGLSSKGARYSVITLVSLTIGAAVAGLIGESAIGTFMMVAGIKLGVGAGGASGARIGATGATDATGAADAAVAVGAIVAVGAETDA
jgi:hypothetical protein